jgi:hypothetical protein
LTHLAKLQARRMSPSLFIKLPDPLFLCHLCACPSGVRLEEFWMILHFISSAVKSKMPLQMVILPQPTRHRAPVYALP